MTNILHGGQTVSTFSGLITCTNCSVNGYEFGQPGMPTPANLGTIPAGHTAIESGGDGAAVDSEFDLWRHPQRHGVRPLQL